MIGPLRPFAQVVLFGLVVFYLEVGGIDARDTSAVQEFHSLDACRKQADIYSRSAAQARLPIVFLCGVSTYVGGYDPGQNAYPQLRLVPPERRRLPTP